MITAWALSWPNDPQVLLFRTFDLAEQNRKWFVANYKRNSQGEFRGEPKIVELLEKVNG